MFHVTFHDNDAPTGSHIYAQEDITTELSVFNQAGTAPGCSFGGGVNTIQANFEDEVARSCTDGHGSVSDFGAGFDAELMPLAFNGGRSRSMIPTSTSPLATTIAAAACVGSPVVDQNGFTRPLDSFCDPGAAEAIAPLKFTVSSPEGDIDVTVSGYCGSGSSYDASTTVVDGAYSPAPPSAVQVPFGVFGFTVCVPTDGGTITVELELPAPVNSVWKVDSAWTQISDALIDGTMVTYTVTDDDPLDQDPADGVIEDPVAPANILSFTR